MSEDFPPEDSAFLKERLDAILDRLENDGFHVLTPTERTVYFAFFFDAEAHNGGFDQFFFNSQGNFARWTVPALEEIGALKAAGLLRRAMEVFGADGPSPDRVERWEQMDGLPPERRKSWNELDEEYYRPGENVGQLLVRWLRSK